ncbi:TetR/AcrR family transcriptional regulator [Parafrankia discariae]|uniref:TetR/AcrR family transcriptional regulator n=1 Tax=Parafrankia discariae TaxID=365528 RepID=UPI000553FC9A|nr:TetR family transcriptional regulator [Parafrankia discariae]
MPNKTVGRGRRPGGSDSRERILAAARERFLADGYQAVTLRSVAAAAGVDSALPSYFFGSKQGLFAASMALAVNPADVLDHVLAGEHDGLAERVLRGVLGVWDDPTSGPPLRTMLTTAMTDPALTRLVREAVGRELIDRLTARFGGPAGREHAAAFSLQVAGLILSRYVLELDPIASMTPDEIIRRCAPALQVVVDSATRP